MLQFTLDAKAAIAAESKSSVITETGAYYCTIKQAVVSKTPKGATEVAFEFNTDSGGIARARVYPQKSDGSVNESGANVVQAMMACLRMRTLNTETAIIEVFDRDAGRTIKAQADILPVSGRKIGVVLQKVIGEHNGKPTAKTEIYAFFEHDSNLTASEILNKKDKPEALHRLLSSVKDKIEKPKVAQAKQYNASGDDWAAPAPQRNEYADAKSGRAAPPTAAFDDDIPF